MVNKLLHAIFYIRNKYIRIYGPVKGTSCPSAPSEKGKGAAAPLPPLPASLGVERLCYVVIESAEWKWLKLKVLGREELESVFGT